MILRLKLRNSSPFPAEHPRTEDEARALLWSDRELYLAIDNDHTSVVCDGSPMACFVIVPSGRVSMRFFRSVVAELVQFNVFPRFLAIDLSVWVSEKQIVNRWVQYLVETNCLRAWENDRPVYENRNGVVCKDTKALEEYL